MEIPTAGISVSTKDKVINLVCKQKTASKLI